MVLLEKNKEKFERLFERLEDVLGKVSTQCKPISSADTDERFQVLEGLNKGLHGEVLGLKEQLFAATKTINTLKSNNTRARSEVDVMIADLEKLLKA